MTGDEWDQLAERARQTALRRPPRTYPPAVLPEIVERRYRTHVTDRAAGLGVREADLTAVLALGAVEHAEQESA